MGNPLNVSNLRSRIAITIPRTPTSNDTHGGQSYFVKPSEEGKMQHHRINVPLAGTSLTLQVVFQILSFLQLNPGNSNCQGKLKLL